MPYYFDLNLSEPSLAQKERQLGFSRSFTSKTIVLNSRKDFREIRGKLVSIQAREAILLKEALKRSSPALINPITSKSFHKDIALVRLARDKNAAFEVPVSCIMRISSLDRAKLFSQLKRFLSNCVKLKASYVFTSRAENEYELKSPGEIIAIAQLLGLSREQAQYSISTRAGKLLREQGLP